MNTDKVKKPVAKSASKAPKSTAAPSPLSAKISAAQKAAPKASAKKPTPAKATAKPAPKAKAAPKKAPAKGKANEELMLARVEAVRLSQREEGCFDCFGRAASGYCDQGGCVYHAECMSVSRMIHAM